MKVIAHTLFKNEERWLWYSVSSVINHVDKLLLWDTGSTDRSWEIAESLRKKYKSKIDLRQYGEVTSETFYKVRQEMLDHTFADWFLVVDGDEIWWDDSIKKLISEIENADQQTESIIVPTVNLVGDMYHYLPESAGKYKFGPPAGGLIGNYNLRAIKRNIKGLHSSGVHGLWGWADASNRQIQDRNTFKFVDAPYMHTTFLPRGEKRVDDLKVPKRAKKLKYEIGSIFPYDYFYPEVFFESRPDFVGLPWSTMNTDFKIKAFIQTPLRKIKRKVYKYGVGY